MKTMKLAMLFAAAMLSLALNACASGGTPAPVVEAQPKPEIKPEAKLPPPPSSERVARLKQLVGDSKTRTLTLEEWREIGELSGWTELSDSAGKALKESKAPPQKADAAQEPPGRRRVEELKARIAKLKQGRDAQDASQAASGDALRLRAESSALQAENAGLKQALSEARARGDEACKFVEMLTARFEELSRKYERMNELMSRK